MGMKFSQAAGIADAMLGDKAAELRADIRDLVGKIAKDGLPVEPTLRAVVQHARLNDDGVAHSDPQHLAHIASLTPMDLRIGITWAAAAHVAGNWTPSEMLREGADEGATVPAALITRMMTGIRFGPTDTEIHNRLIESLTAYERGWLVCSLTAMLGTLGFTASDIAMMIPFRGDQDDQDELGEAVKPSDPHAMASDDIPAGGQLPQTD